MAPEAERESTPRVELLWWRGCPSWRDARAQLAEAMRAAGLDPDSLESRELTTEAAARDEGFAGSPTIRVDGRDVQASGDQPAALTCRVYRLRDGRPSPLPDPDDLREALEAAR